MKKTIFVIHLTGINYGQSKHLRDLKDIILEAHKKAKEDNYIGTDDGVLAERLGYRVKIIEGSYENIKITTAEDLLIGETIIKNL